MNPAPMEPKTLDVKTEEFPFWSLSWGSMVRDAVTCLSLANLWFIRVWQETLAIKDGQAALLVHVPGRTDNLATVAAVFLLALLFFGVVRFSRKYLHRNSFRSLRFLSLALILVPLNGFRAILSTQPALGAKGKYLKSPLLELVSAHTLVLIVIPLSLVLLWFLWTTQTMVIKVCVVALISLFPFCIFTIGQSLLAAIRYSGQPAMDLPSAPKLSNPKTIPRVVWAIWDEWDYRLTYKDRPAKLEMPAIDRLTSESLTATNAYSPAMDTGTSLPSLLTGHRMRMVENSEPAHFSAEEVEGLDRVSWKETPNIFSATRRAGYNSAVIGWYLPYCRMFNTFVTDCAWWPMPTQATSRGNSFAGLIYGDTRSLFETDSLSPFGQSLAVKQKTEVTKGFLARAERAVTDPETGFVFLHVPVPHAPHSYNRFTGKFDEKNNPLRGYVDSLALLDKMAGTLRDDMERAGLWDKTVVIFSADHPFRIAEAIDGKRDPRVPVLIHFPGETTSTPYGRPMHTIVTAQFVLAVVRGEISNRSQAMEWFDRHQNDLDLPVQ